MKLLDKLLSLFEEWTLFITVLVAMVALFFKVVLRYGFSYSLAWSEELVREVILYTTFIGCSAAIKKRSTLRVDALVQLVPVLKFPLTIFSYSVNLLFAAVLVYFGTLLCLLQYRSDQATVILRIPTVYLYAILPLMGLMMVLRVLIVMRDDIRDQRVASQPRSDAAQTTLER
jgi:TRAP-type C4-dicarboxylate transport system permease small subunit